MDGIVFNDVRVFDGNPIAPFPAQVRVEANRITHVARRGELTVARPRDRIYECAGATLMPGLVEAHARLSWPSSIEKTVPHMTLPPEELALTTARNARILLDHGYTSAYSAGSLNRCVEAALNGQIESGGLPGPRIVTSSVERVPSLTPPATARATDDFDPHGPGPDAVRAFVRTSATLGARSVKFVLSGEGSLQFGALQPLLCNDEEASAAADEAQRAGVWLAARAQTPDAIKMAVRHGFRVLYHCAYADEEALDMLEAAREQIFVSPATGIVDATLAACRAQYRAAGAASGTILACATVLALRQQLVPQLRSRGVRVLLGRDHGLPFCPHGKNACDLQRFVDLFDYTPLEALNAATALGGQLMGLDGELGRIRPGYLADLLLVNGDPTEEIAILQDKANLLAIMKNGCFHKAPAPPVR